MFKAEKKQFKKIKNSFKKLPRVLGEHAFLTSMCLFLIAGILGGLVFYKYSILAEQRKPESSQSLLNFDEKNLQSVISIWQERQTKFDQADFKQYSNPFKITQ